jgi:Phage Mu protein F like protein
VALTQPRQFQRGPAWQIKFLQREAGSTANLFDFVQQARAELDDFIRTGSLTASDTGFYRALQHELAVFQAKLDGYTDDWIEKNVKPAFDIGAETHAPSIVIPRDALEALSQNTLGLIRQIPDEMRREIRHLIASGILTGISGQELRTRIIQTGIGRGRWPTVEYRAGVIARTETMRAYNEGARAGMAANGAHFARWIISPDEAVCQLCFPYAGKVFRLQAFVDWQAEIGGPNPYPDAPMLPKLPRHPRCRCTIAAVYRGPDGNVLGARTAPTEPAPPPAIADEPVTMPPAAGDFEGAFAKLGTVDFRITDPATAQFWRSIELDPDMRAQLANTSDVQAIDDFLRARYGIEFAPKGTYDPVLKRAIIDALEAYRGVRPEWVTDSGYLKTIGPHSMGPNALDGGVLGVAYADGRVAFDFEAIAGGKKYGDGPLRMGPNVKAGDEIAIHEFAHTLHNRLGAHSKFGYGPAEFGWERKSFAEIQRMTPEEVRAWGEKNALAEVQGEEWAKGWAKARRASAGIAPDGKIDAAEIARNREILSHWQTRVDAYRREIETGQSTYGRVLSKAEIAFAKRELKKAEQYVTVLRAMIEGTSAGNPSGQEFYPTDYARTNEFEDFAESVTMYMLNPQRLRTYAPKRYAFIRDSVFGGVEFG